jgi:hypothetical protein
VDGTDATTIEGVKFAMNIGVSARGTASIAVIASDRRACCHGPDLVLLATTRIANVTMSTLSTAQNHLMELLPACQ